VRECEKGEGFSFINHHQNGGDEERCEIQMFSYLGVLCN